MYFTREPLNAPNLQLQTGDQFEFQSKPYLRRLAECYGVEGGDQRPFHTLKYIGLLLVPRRLYAEIRNKKLTYCEARALLDRWRAAQAG